MDRETVIDIVTDITLGLIIFFVMCAMLTAPLWGCWLSEGCSFYGFDK